MVSIILNVEQNRNQTIAFNAHKRVQQLKIKVRSHFDSIYWSVCTNYSIRKCYFYHECIGNDLLAFPSTPISCLCTVKFAAAVNLLWINQKVFSTQPKIGSNWKTNSNKKELTEKMSKACVRVLRCSKFNSIRFCCIWIRCFVQVKCTLLVKPCAKWYLST